jgi:hypothetical protein
VQWAMQVLSNWPGCPKRHVPATIGASQHPMVAEPGPGSRLTRAEATGMAAVAETGKGDRGRGTQRRSSTGTCGRPVWSFVLADQLSGLDLGTETAGV